MDTRIVVFGGLAAIGAAFALTLVLPGCGGQVEPCQGAACQVGGGGAGGGGGAENGGGDVCMLDPPGKTFTFHVHNAGTQSLRLTYGCGGTLPITVTTPKGALPIGPGAANGCEITCDEVYNGTSNNGCSDCGPGEGAPLAPGDTADIAWDRRVYTAFVAAQHCSGHAGGNDCALGTDVSATTMQKGELTVCNAVTSPDGGGFCATQSETTVSFTLDTSKSEGTIEVM